MLIHLQTHRILLATSLSLFTFVHWRRKWQPTPVFLPGESQGQGSLVSCRLSSDLAAAAEYYFRKKTKSLFMVSSEDGGIVGM